MSRRRKMSFDRTLSLAKKAINQGNTARATQLYRSILHQQPNHIAAKHGLRKLQEQSSGKPAPPKQSNDPPQDQFATLISLYQSGELNEAEQMCRKLLERYPQSVIVLNALGATLRKKGRIVEAIEHYNKAIESNPQHADTYNNLGNALRKLGRKQDALNNYNKALLLNPQDEKTHNNRGLLYYEMSMFEEAAENFNKALQLNPQNPQTYNNLGNTLRKLGRKQEALANFDNAIQHNPHYAEAYNNRGLLLQDSGRLENALDSYKHALQLNPGFIKAINNQGRVLRQQGKLEEALASFEKAIELHPRYAEAYNNRGITLRELGRKDAALESFDTAIQLHPRYAVAYYNRANSLQKLGRLDEALESYNKALELKPDLAEALNNLGLLLQDMGRLKEAEAAYRRALQLNPNHRHTYSNLLFLLNYVTDRNAEEIFAEYRKYDKRFGLPLREHWHPHTRSHDPQRRLRIGYVSPDFSKHSTRFFLEPLLAQHNHERFEITAYAEVRKKDTLTKRYLGYVDRWVRTNELSDAELAERIRADGIDILVDLAGHTAKNRLGVFARKPAPVSVSWLGYGYTTGLAAVDYFLTDAATVPSGSEHLFSETPWRIDTPAFAYRPAEGMGEISPLPASQRGYITFGTLTRAVRINHRTIRVWSEILKRVRNARLVINSINFKHSTAQEALAKRFVLEGIEAERLIIGYTSPPWELLRTIDITLDCFPHNSGTTLFESLYMGIPFITLTDRPSVGRLGSSILEGVGHPEWITHSETEYIDKAVALAGDLDRLAQIRSSLRRELQSGPLMDEQGFVRKVEHAYLQMFAQWSSKTNRPATNEPRQQAPPIPAPSAIPADPPQTQLKTVVGLYTSGKLAEAENECKKLLDTYPQSAIVCNLLGAVLISLGRMNEALQSIDKAIQHNPQYAEAYNNRGITLKKIGRTHEALQSIDKAIQYNPQYADAFYNRGNALQDLGRLEDALVSYNHVLEFNPQYTQAYNNRGTVLRELGRTDAALKSLDTAIQLHPHYAEAYNNRGLLLHDVGRLDEALESYNKALELKPDLAEALNNLGLLLQDMGRLKEAEAAYRRALQLNPNHRHTYSNLLFLLNYVTDRNAEEIFAEYRKYDKRFGLPLREHWHPHTRSHDPQRRLRIGYVSPDFSKHSTRFFLEPLLAHHDHDRFEVFAYAEERKQDAYTMIYRNHVDHWVRTNRLSDAELSGRIRKDGIDILVDLAGHTNNNRLGVFARKPAPVSVSWLGYGYTTGLAAVDYFLTDAATVPSGSEHLFSETPWRIDTPAFAYRPAEGMGEISPLPASQRGYITFGTLTRAIRVNHRTIRVWSEILKRVDNSRLVVNSINFKHSPAQQALIERFALEGIGPEHLIIGCTSPPWDLLRTIDITLDCFPHNSGTTLFESLYMGIPFITLAERPSVGRLGASILEGAEHQEWIAHSETEYIDKAVALAGDLDRLAQIRSSLRRELQSGPLMDEQGFAHQVEHAYQQMLERWYNP